jgi:DNA-binding NarL/FixJ family response regulator
MRMKPGTKNQSPKYDFRNSFAHFLPQVAERDTPRVQDVPGEYVLYDECMTRVFIADALPEERSALRLVLLDLNMEVVGEAASWTTTLSEAPTLRPDMLLIDWSMLPNGTQSAAMAGLREACPGALVIVLISHLDARQQAAMSSGADTFISKGETPERVSERLRSVAAGIRPASGRLA